MKKIFAIALAVLMVMSVVLGCSGNKKQTPPANKATVTSQNKDNSNAAKAPDKV